MATIKELKEMVFKCLNHLKYKTPGSISRELKFCSIQISRILKELLKIGLIRQRSYGDAAYALN